MSHLFANLGRRRLLKYIGATGMLAGFLGGKLRALAASAQEKRVVFVYVPGGATPHLWMPIGCERSFTLGPVSAPLEPVKQHCVFLDDIRVPYEGPGATDKTLGGYLFGDTTVDVALGEHLQGDAAYPNLFLSSTDLKSSYDVSASKANGQEIEYDFNPLEVYQRLFAGDARYLQEKLPSFVQSFEVNPAQVLGSFDKTTDLNMELATLALQLNKTRVVTLMLGGSNGFFLAPESGYSDSYSQSIHSGPFAHYDQFRTYLTTKLLYLIQLLQGATDRNGQSLLDNTIVVQVTDTGFAPGVDPYRAPFLLAGGRNLIHNGLYLRQVRDFSHVLDTVTTALGLPQANFGAGPLANLLKQPDHQAQT